MSKNEKNILIFGAGRIGRGFIADLFDQAGYTLTLVDTDIAMVERLRTAGRYTLLHIMGKEEQHQRVITRFTVLSLNQTSDLNAALRDCTLAAVCVFPAAFESVADVLIAEIERRAASLCAPPLDVLVCANINLPSALLRESIAGKLTEQGQRYFDDNVGLLDSTVMRMAIEPSVEQKAADSLIVVTNGYGELPVEAHGFKGPKPQVPGMVFVDNMRAEETRKLYTYNMLHALYAYIGTPKGYATVYECTQDPSLQAVANGALEEVSHALMCEFAYSRGDMHTWKQQVLKNMENPALIDKLTRVGADPVRKLKRGDRLTGPALLCRKHGILPYYITQAMAYAFLYNAPDDPTTDTLEKTIRKAGIKQAVVDLCQLSKEPDLVQLVAEHYARSFEETKQDPRRVSVMKDAYERGFQSEKSIKGCAQCVLAAVFNLTGQFNSLLFQAASGFSGGMAITGDGCCGGYSGGILAMGTFAGRRWEKIEIDGDKVEQYKSYEMAQKLHDRFLQTYGSVICADIHRLIFDQAYCLRTKEVRNAFELAGAHIDKCTTVVATASAWVAEILLDEGFITLSTMPAGTGC